MSRRACSELPGKEIASWQHWLSCPQKKGLRCYQHKHSAAKCWLQILMSSTHPRSGWIFSSHMKLFSCSLFKEKGGVGDGQGPFPGSQPGNSHPCPIKQDSSEPGEALGNRVWLPSLFCLFLSTCVMSVWLMGRLLSELFTQLFTCPNIERSEL